MRKIMFGIAVILVIVTFFFYTTGPNKTVGEGVDDLNEKVDNVVRENVPGITDIPVIKAPTQVEETKEFSLDYGDETPWLKVSDWKFNKWVPDFLTVLIKRPGGKIDEYHVAARDNRKKEDGKWVKFTYETGCFGTPSECEAIKIKAGGAGVSEIGIWSAGPISIED